MEQNISTPTDVAILEQLPYLQMGSAFFIGMSLGYLLKKSFKLMLLLVGLVIALLFGLEHFGYIAVSASKLHQGVSEVTGAFESLFFLLKDRLSTIGAAGSGSALAGFLIGLKMG